MATVTISPDRSQRVETFAVYFTWNENVTGFTTSNISLSAGIKGEFTGSNSVYKLDITPPAGTGSLIVTVATNSVDQNNIRTALSITYGVTTPSVSVTNNSTTLFARGLAYRSNAVYLISRSISRSELILMEATHQGVVSTTRRISNYYGGGQAIDFIGDRVIIDEYPGRFTIGLVRSTANIGALSNVSFESELFISLPEVSQGTDFQSIKEIAVGLDKIFVMFTQGFLPTEASVNIYDLNGNETGSFSIPLNDSNEMTYRTEPRGLVATDERLFLGIYGWANDQALRPARILAYSFDGEREEDNDIILPTSLFPNNRDTKIASLDWDATNNKIWSLYYEDRGATLFGKLFSVDLQREVNASWEALPDLTLKPGESINLNNYTTNTTSIQFSEGYERVDWLSLSNGVLSIASSGLPSVSPTIRIPLIAIGSNRPSFTRVNLTVNIPTAPRWQIIPNLVREAGDTLNLNEMVAATTIEFKTGYTNSLNLTISNGIITIPEDAVTQDTDHEIELTATNAIGATDATIPLT